jgi:Domain of unknown function (DUF5919)
MTGAVAHIGVLVFSGTFYAQTQPKVAAMLADAAARGVEVRLCFGDPASDAVATRDREEGLGGTLAAKIRSALTYYRPLAAVDGCQLRLHGTTLYTSLFRYDEEIMANPHAYGEPASAGHDRGEDGLALAVGLVQGVVAGREVLLAGAGAGVAACPAWPTAYPLADHLASGMAPIAILMKIDISSDLVGDTGIEPVTSSV